MGPWNKGEHIFYVIKMEINCSQGMPVVDYQMSTNFFLSLNSMSGWGALLHLLNLEWRCDFLWPIGFTSKCERSKGLTEACRVGEASLEQLV